MKNEEMLQDAIGMIDDALVLEAKKHDKPRPVWIRWVAVVACLALIVGCVGYFGSKPEEPNSVAVRRNQIQLELAAVENLWQQEDFSAYSLTYSGVSELSGTGGRVVLLADETTAIQAQSITISQEQTVKFENLIAQRYAVYLSETGFPVFYDTVEDRELDLQQRILGDTSHILDRFMELAYEAAEEQFAGFVASEVNRQILELYLTCLANDTLSENWDQITSIIPDTSFMDDMPEYSGVSEEQRRSICWNMGWEISYAAAPAWEEEKELRFAPYVVEVLGIDETNGICIVRGNTLTGDGAMYAFYDIRTDTLQDLPDAPSNDLIGVMQKKGYTFRFSNDGTIATIAYPSCDFYGVSYTHVLDYQGEKLGVFFLGEDSASRWGNQHLAASQLYISQNKSVLYYKRMDENLAGRDFCVSEEVWARRLTLFGTEADRWVFHPVEEGKHVGQAVELEGKLIRLAAEDRVAIMKRGGSYYAYSLEDGSDITQDVLEGRVSMYAHELLEVVMADGILYTSNIFTGEKKTIGSAQEYILTEDGAFVFAHQQGDDHVTCYNVATLENCQIQIDSALCDQLFSGENVVLQMSYNPEENTLLISYYLQEDVATEDDVDFYDLLGRLEPGSVAERPTDPTVITDLTVTEDIMEQFRDSAYRYDHPDGIIYWWNYYPEGLEFYTDRHSVFAFLGLTEPEDYLDVKGTKFILYEDEDETLALVFWEWWELYDYEDWYAGFHIEYTANGKTYDYEFLVEDAQ